MKAGRRSALRRGAAIALAVAGLTVAVVTTAATTAPPADRDPTVDAATAAADDASTVEVDRRSLVEEREIRGATVDYGESYPLPLDGADRTVTRSPSSGAVVGPGDEVVRLDDRPVYLAAGDMPLYRPLRLERRQMRGRDVRQLQQFLRRQGWDGLRVDRVFGPGTRTAVREWQRSVGLPVTGEIDRTQLSFTPAPVRIASAPRVGAAFDEVQVTDRTQRVTVPVSNADRPFVQRDADVTVRTAEGEIQGTVTAVREAAVQGGSPELKATIAPAEPLGADVSSATIVARRTVASDVLAAPVRALLALAEGGYAVERPGGELVPVTVGEVADGYAEVRGAVNAGDRVVAPS